MQNNKAKNLNFTEILSNEPDNILSLDVSSVKTLQIGYQAETLFLHKATDDTLTIKEYINGLTGSEYYAKVTANRFKTTIRYGRREAVNPATCIEIFLPDSYNGELLLSSQYGNIMTDADWKVERFYLSEYNYCTSNPTRFFYKSDSYHKSRGFYRYPFCFRYNYCR